MASIMVSSISQRKRDTHVPQTDSMMSLPRSLHEAYKLHLSRTQHPAMKMFGSSIQAHRSCNEAILFLYGISGAGKSATLNHLFDSELIPTSDSISCTDSMIEWVSTFASEHWQVSNLEVGFIDVPGWGDSLGRDAANLSLIQHFLTIHPILGSKIRKFYPNIVLLVFNSNDNRIFGEEARAQKMLQSISKLDIVDKEHPNVVIVLTHVCSHPASEFKNSLQKLGDRYQQLSRSYLGVNSPVVWLENNPGYPLEKKGDWTLLYDGTAQPLNLYNAIIKLMEDAKDELGKEAIRLYFKDRASNSLPKERLIVNSMNVDSKLRTKLEDRWREEISRKTSIHPKSTKLTTHLCKYIETHSDPKLKESEIQGLLLALNCSTSFHDVKSIEGKPLSFVQDQLLPYPLTVDEKVLLLRALRLEIPDMPQCLNALGSGYNVLKEEICSHAAIFEFSKSEYFDPFLNCFVSKSLTIYPCKSYRMTFGTLDKDTPSKIVKFNEKLKEISLILNVNIKNLSPVIEIFNILPLFWIETGVFMAQLNFPHLTLSKEFCDIINSLPQLSLDEAGQIKKEFSDLFEKYGQFAIIKATGGGLIEGKLKIQKLPTSPAEYISRVESMLDLYNNLILEGNNWRQFKEDLPADDVLVLKELDSAPLLWFAGNKDFTSKILKEISHESYSNWLKSLKSSSVFFDYSFNLVPIHLLAQNVNPEAANQIKIAFESLLKEENTGPYYAEDDIDLKCLGSESEKIEIPIEPIGTPTKTSGSTALSRHKKTTKAIPESPQTDQITEDPSNRRSICEINKTNIKSLKVTCFPADSYVELKNGNHIRMKELQIGDYVLSLDSRTGRSVYSKVFMWGHFDPDLSATFIEIHHEEGVLRISENHLLMHGRDRSFTTAANIKEGDTVHHFQRSDSSLGTYRLSEIEVKSINRCELVGVFAPFTHNSLLVVDGLVCSAFAIPDTSISQLDLFEKVSRICMSPICLMDRMGLAQKLKNPLNDTTKIHWYAEFLLRLYHLFPSQVLKK